MHKNQALNILEISGDYTPESIKLAYRKACAKFHPDRNPAGLEMMKLVNQAYDMLKDSSGTLEQDDVTELAGELFDAISKIIHLSFDIELCGSWVWLHGDTKPHKETLKEASFKWAPKKKLWYFRPSDHKSFSRGKYSIDEIRSMHGSKKVSELKSNARLAG